jgi:hypothetical protein
MGEWVGLGLLDICHSDAEEELKTRGRSLDGVGVTGFLSSPPSSANGYIPQIHNFPEKK